MLALTLLVRDEADILEANIEFHLSVGVDFVIATDHRSVDETPEILDRYVRAGVLKVIRESAPTYEQHKWVTRMARVAYDSGADWVINSDADEFWWPVEGDLKSSLCSVTADFDVVAAQRANFPPIDDGLAPFWLRQIFRDTHSLNILGQPLPPKVAHRARHDIQVAQGNHSVHAAGLGPILDDGRIEILHFPLRTYAQFETKIVNGGRAYEMPGSPPPNVGQTWRYAYREWESGRLGAIYDAQSIAPWQLARRVASGALVRDLRLHDALVKIGRPFDLAGWQPLVNQRQVAS